MGRKARSDSDRQTGKNESFDGGMAIGLGVSDASRIVVLHGEINEAMIATIIAQLFHLASINLKPIHLVISTYGGSVDEMFALYDTIKFLPCPVHTIALGKVMSAGVLLLASGTKGKRMIGRSSRIMIHPVIGTTSGNVFEVVGDTNEHVQLQEQMVAAISRETKTPKSELEKIMKTGHDVYLRPTRAIQLGIADVIIGDRQ